LNQEPVKQVPKTSVAYRVLMENEIPKMRHT
jgi:hypothetical protein